MIFYSRHFKNIQEEFLLSLSPLEKKLAEVVDRVEIRGKKGRRVAVLLPGNLRRQLDYLVKNRGVGNVNEDNLYMFARPGDSQFPVRATDVIRKFANDCGAKQPELLNSTSFRKYIAVIAQMLNLKDNELGVLAGFLGHDIRVHREFYRLPQDTVQVAKVSKLLLGLERGNIHKYKGQSLDEIQFDLEEPLEVDEDGEEETDLTEISEGPSYENIVVKPGKASDKPSKQSPKPMKRSMKHSSTRKSWNENELAAVKRQLEKYFFMEKLPGKHQIEEARKREPLLLARPWVQI